jgi:ubiquinone/menaquinone biosynthesis C-methylase UbiE
MSGRPWNASYLDGVAPWDLGRPQPAVIELVADVDFAGPVLDVGCGTGEHALLLASRGCEVVGVDVAESALAIARAKAIDRGLHAEFVAADALCLDRLGRQFHTVLDCGLFHTFDVDERRGYVKSLAAATAPGGSVYVLCFSDKGPDRGPHPVSRDELQAAFTTGDDWDSVAIDVARLYSRLQAGGARAWLATVKRR